MCRSSFVLLAKVPQPVRSTCRNRQAEIITIHQTMSLVPFSHDQTWSSLLHSRVNVEMTISSFPVAAKAHSMGTGVNLDNHWLFNLSGKRRSFAATEDAHNYTNQFENKDHVSVFSSFVNDGPSSDTLLYILKGRPHSDLLAFPTLIAAYLNHLCSKSSKDD